MEPLRPYACVAAGTAAAVKGRLAPLVACATLDRVLGPRRTADHGAKIVLRAATANVPTIDFDPFIGVQGTAAQDRSVRWAVPRWAGIATDILRARVRALLGAMWLGRTSPQSPWRALPG
jgi:hypothetical protein